jgi:para-aminobenzoate synthetase
VISPGPGTPERPKDIGSVIEIIRELTDIAILGVCLGHQALAAAHGARIQRAPSPVHGRLSRISHNGHALFSGIPSTEFQVVRYHSLLVQEMSLTPELEAICWTEGGDVCLSLEADDAPNTIARSLNTRLLMGIAHCTRPHFGVQFHPESIATQFGVQLLSNFAALSRKALAMPAAPRLGMSKRTTPFNSYLAFDTEAKSSSRDTDVLPCPEAQTPAEHRSHTASLQLMHECIPLQRGVTGNYIMEMLNWGGEPDTFWLDSADDIRGRFSYLGGPGGLLWLRMTYNLPNKPKHTADQDCGCNGVETAAGSLHGACTVQKHQTQCSHAAEECGGRGFQAQTNSHRASCAGTATVCGADGSRYVENCTLRSWLTRFLNKHKLPPDDAACKLPFDFKGGLVGFIGYEMKAECGGSMAHRSRYDLSKLQLWKSMAMYCCCSCTLLAISMECSLPDPTCSGSRRCRLS